MGIFSGIGEQFRRDVQSGLRNEVDRAQHQARTEARMAVYHQIERPMVNAVERTMGGLERQAVGGFRDFAYRTAGMEDPGYRGRGGYYPGTPGFNPYAGNPYPNHYPAPQAAGGYGQQYGQYRQRPEPEISEQQRAALYRQQYRREHGLPDNAPVPGYGTGAASPPPSATTAPAATPSAPPVAAPTTTVAAPAAPAAPVAKPVELAVQQQQAYLKILGYEGKLDGKAENAEAAMRKYAHDKNIPMKDGKLDVNAVNQSLLDEMKHGDKAKAFMDKARKDITSGKFTADEVKAAQWVLKEQQGSDMPKSLKNGMMDGVPGKETKGLAKEPFDYKRPMPAAPAAPAATPPAAVPSVQASVTLPSLQEEFGKASRVDVMEELRRQHAVAQKVVNGRDMESPDAVTLTEMAGLDPNKYLEMKNGSDVKLDNKAAPAGPAQDASSNMAMTRKLDTMGMG